MEQIFNRPDLAGCMAFKCHPRIGHAHALAIIYHLHQSLTRVSNNEFDFGSAGVNGILE